MNLSKTLSYILRHHPEKFNIKLDTFGYADTKDLMTVLNCSLLDIRNSASEGDKQRFQFTANCEKIRAIHGHSIDVDLDYKVSSPPKYLYHGTTKRFLDSIYKEGIKSQSRQYVHLTESFDMAYEIGIRHGSPVILTVESGRMYDDEIDFYNSKNGVWLVKHVSSQYIIDEQNTKKSKY